MTKLCKNKSYDPRGGEYCGKTSLSAAASSLNVLKTPALSKSYGEFKLYAPELELELGKIYAVIGANGSGKSTLGKLLCGIEEPGFASSKLVKAGCMTQKSFAFSMSVKKNIMLAAESEARADKLIEQLGLSAFKDKNAKQLSGGQCARMALARALAGNFPLLVLDEPAASMDMQSTLQAEACILSYARQKRAVILITHSIPQAQRIADEIIFMENGQIVEQGKSSQLLKEPKDPRTKAFLEFASF